jgi:hypothetical protein
VVPASASAGMKRSPTTSLPRLEKVTRSIGYLL